MPSTTLLRPDVRPDFSAEGPIICHLHRRSSCTNPARLVGPTKWGRERPVRLASLGSPTNTGGVGRTQKAAKATRYLKSQSDAELLIGRSELAARLSHMPSTLLARHPLS